MAEEDMSARLKVHMERVHRLYGTDDEGKRGGMEHPPSSDAMAGGRMNDPNATYSETYEDDLAQRGEDLYGGEAPLDSLVIRRRAGKIVLFCPMCGFELLGKNGKELSKVLKEHMMNNNEIEGTVVHTERPSAP